MAWLIDKSAYVRLMHARPAARAQWDTRIQRGLVQIAGVTRLEVGFAVRNGADGREVLASPPLSLMPVAYLTPAMEDRAHEVQMLLADKGHHRAPSIPDLLIAATAELSGLTVLAADKDFNLIADITGQRIEWCEAG